MIFRRDKGGKDQYQVIIENDIVAVKEFFDRCKPNERLFPHIDHDLDLHGIRAEHARRMYQYFEKMARTPAGREQLRHQLWARYTDPEIGCKAWLLAQEKGDKSKLRKLEYRFRKQMGLAARKKMERQFEKGMVVEKTVAAVWNDG